MKKYFLLYLLMVKVYIGSGYYNETDKLVAGLFPTIEFLKWISGATIDPELEMVYLPEVCGYMAAWLMGDNS